MIDSDVQGQRKLEALFRAIDSFDWFDNERSALDGWMEKGVKYSAMSAKQKNWVGRMYDRLEG
jgi:hypothetical protein